MPPIDPSQPPSSSLPLRPKKPRWKHARFGLVIAVGLIVLAPIIAFFIVQTLRPSPSSSSGIVAEEPERAVDLVNGMCVKNRPFKNATAFTKGRNTIIVGKQGLLKDDAGNYSYSELIIDFKDPAVRTAQEVHQTNKVSVVGCVKRATETKTSQTCEYENTTLNVYNVEYKLELYEAQTGKLITTKNIGMAPEFECQWFVQFDAKTKRVYKLYDIFMIENGIKDVL